nr:DUF364 domain-containing protein [bacterium]
GKNLVVVGDFPFLRKLEGEVRSLTVIGRPPGEGEEGVREAAGPLSRADVAAVSASAFINRTAADLLALCPRAYTVLLGPTAPFSPVLFRRGVDVVCGSRVEDPARVRAYVSQGASFRQIRGLKLVAWFKPEAAGA